MSQDYFGAAGSSKQPQTPGTPDRAPRHRWERPNYMAVGSGSPSEHAERLTSMLDHDSGYGSLADGVSSSSKWDIDALVDRPTPTFSPLAPGAPPPQNETDRKTVQNHVHQLHYNHNRTALARAITKVTEALRRLQAYNRDWPAHYPSVPAPASTQHGPNNSSSPTSPRSQRYPDVRPGLTHTQSNMDDDRPNLKPRPGAIRRADTSIGEGTTQAESSNVAAQRPVPEPRLVTPQLARDFSVLKIDLKMDGVAQTEIIHSLRKDSKALAQLLDGQINKSLRHLSALRERIEDTSSKVLVTGDLNAGKSTFCNSLLRRKILPEDEQPCTSIFCEVLDVRENGGVEEVHAILVGAKYDRRDERTFDAHPLEKLEKIVTDSERYSQCKVYVKDVRPVDESLLNNGVLDIALIDAPGLNNDSLKTTAVFARQEEIDVVVFVVSAANHFTLSAREFIYDAAREKAYIFMVVNGFDAIKNKDRCQEQILKQIAHLSPATFKESPELVHFVSSNAIPVAPLAPSGGSGYPGSSGSGSSSLGGQPSDEPNDDSADDSDNDSETKHSPEGTAKGKGKEKALQRRDFAALESSLRRFVLEKRARSKLAPAKTYLLNLLDDVHSLANVNRDVAQNELDRVAQELADLAPTVESSQKARDTAGAELEDKTEMVASGIYEHTRSEIDACVTGLARKDLGITYPGFWDAYSYSQDLVSAMLGQITETVSECEDYARKHTGEGVNMVKSLGLLHLGDNYSDSNLTFASDRMFRRRKDALARQVDIDVDLWDFFDVSSLLERHEKAVGSGMAVTVAGVVGGRLMGGVGWIDGAIGAARVLGSRGVTRLIVPGMVLGAFLTAAWFISSVPTTLPRRLSSKLSTQLQTLDFTHANALRISAEVRKALKIPSDNLRIGLQRNLEALRRTQDEKAKTKIESEVARKWFGNLVRESEEVRRSVAAVDLEAGYAEVGSGA